MKGGVSEVDRGTKDGGWIDGTDLTWINDILESKSYTFQIILSIYDQIMTILLHFI